MVNLPPDLPKWCLTSSANTLRAMQAQDYPNDEVYLLCHRGVYYSDLVAAAVERETVAGREWK